jgi:anaerobic selenocysteine-containing dehydrogenase
MSARRIRGANSAPSQQPLADTRAPNENDRVETSPYVADRVAKTTCYMCACRCGIDVHVRDGKIRYINGNKDHPVNRGVLCGKGSAGIMQHYSPARLKKPVLRSGPRGSGEFREIEWNEALSIAAERLGKIRATDPKKLAFFTGRDQSQSLTGWWASRFGTLNFAAHGGFCSVNMAAGGLYSIGGSFWEFGEPDWENARYFMLFGVAEDHDSNPNQNRHRQAEGARRESGIRQSLPHRLQCRSRRLDRYSARHGRRFRACARA